MVPVREERAMLFHARDRGKLYITLQQYNNDKPIRCSLSRSAVPVSRERAGGKEHVVRRERARERDLGRSVHYNRNSNNTVSFPFLPTPFVTPHPPNDSP